MSEKMYPSISIIIPTLNSERTLEACLKSIRSQKYPKDIEIIIADGGSTDATLLIAGKYKATIVKNNLKTGEAGKAVGYKASNGEIVGFIDSDNVLPESDWLQKIITPFIDDGEVVASEPVYFVYRENDHWLTRYFALLGMGDPVNLFIGWYDKYSYITNRWTGINIKTEDKKDYFSFYLEKNIPTIGANGFFVRKNKLLRYSVKDYLFDIDVLKALSKNSRVKVAKVKIGIIHLFSGDINTFIRKQKRRIKDYLFFNKHGLRVGDVDGGMVYRGIVKFVMSTALILPLLVQALIGYLRKKDVVWLFHPVACWLTLLVYVMETIKSPFIKGIYNREGWKQ